MSSFWRDLASTIGRYFIVAACLLPWAALNGVLAASGHDSPVTRGVAVALGLATTTLAWRTLDRRAQRRWRRHGVGGRFTLPLEAYDVAAIAQHTFRAELEVQAAHGVSDVWFHAATFRGRGHIHLQQLQALDMSPEVALPVLASIHSVARPYSLTLVQLTAEEAVVADRADPQVPFFGTGTGGTARLLYAH